MDSHPQGTQKTYPPSLTPVPGSDPRPRRKPAGRKPLKGIDEILTARGFLMVLQAAFPKLNAWLNGLPDPRMQEMCLYTSAHLWWHIIATYLSRKGSRNGFDEQRQSGQVAWNMGLLCGQSAEDARFDGEPTVTCSDNAAYHASRVAPEVVAHIPVLMFRELLERRLFDGARLFNRWYRIVLDGSLKEKCRQGFHQGGKSSTNGARYRYVLQASVAGPAGTLFPLMHEEMDVHNPVLDKEDCELACLAGPAAAVELKDIEQRLPICPWLGRQRSIAASRCSWPVKQFD
jgi:hypothetical protein